MVLGKCGASQNQEADIEVAVFPEQGLEEPLVIHAGYFFWNIQPNSIFLHEGDLGVRFATKTWKTGIYSNLMPDSFEKREVDCR